MRIPFTCGEGSGCTSNTAAELLNGCDQKPKAKCSNHGARHPCEASEIAQVDLLHFLLRKQEREGCVPDDRIGVNDANGTDDVQR